MPNHLENAFINALAGMKSGPRPLREAVDFYASQDGMRLKNVEDELARRIRSTANDVVRNQMVMALAAWDWEHEAKWVAGTKRLSTSRRGLIYKLLRVGDRLKSSLEKLPFYRGEQEILIEAPGSVSGWYSPAFRAAHDFYWGNLQKHLIERRGLSRDVAVALGAKASRVISHLADPASATFRTARGLVVGYVQSGKTTNFTAVIAKAIDAGYRLIIVLSGTTDLLRNQTQRRLDMELSGRENVLRKKSDGDDHDYSTDPAWPEKFISYSRLPSLQGSVDVLRLTGREDFQDQSAGINPVDFEFEKKEKLKALFERENLDHANARLIVVKKQTHRLQKLSKFLRGAGKESCAEIPALIIDDESDQASVNTLNPRKPKASKSGRSASKPDERTAINGWIVKLLEQLPRAQYIGYTATPFANCFVNIDDPADIYPAHFMVSLDRPAGYMGASDFHDFEPPAPGRLSNEKAHVRGIPRDKKPKDDLLAEAVDAFVLTAAIKEFRQAKGKLEFPQHTMLVHDSPLTGDHHETAKRIRKVWKKAGYDSPSAVARLWNLLEDDFRPVWKDRGRDFPLPSSRDQLKQSLGKALARIRRNGDPVLIVNSAEGADVPDFDKSSVWKIIVGGAKLSRGYTVEGLTISYFRRRSKNQDTLMQMGRWFGFREGYRDLVRLYIGRKEPDGKRPPFDLYKAFEALCKDEEDFRRQLKTYETGHDGKPGLTPRDIPALVFNSHPRLRPTAPNKMFNARLTWAGFDYREPTQQAMETGPRKANEKAFRTLVSSPSIKPASAKIGRDRFQVYWRTSTNDEIIKLLAGLDWGGKVRYLEAEIEFLRRKPSPVKGWTVVMPQLKNATEAGRWTVGKFPFRKFERARQATRFGGFSSPEHVRFAKWLVGRPEEGDAGSCTGLKASKENGVLLVYPTSPTINGKRQGGPPVMGFALVLPGSDQSQRIAFTTIKKRSDVIVSRKT